LRGWPRRRDYERACDELALKNRLFDAPLAASLDENSLMMKSAKFAVLMNVQLIGRPRNMNKQSLFRYAFVALPLATMLGLPFFTNHAPSLPLYKLQNIVWGLVYGFGWFLTISLFDLYSLSIFPLRIMAVLFGALIWPALVSRFLYVLGGRVWERLDRPLWKALFLVFLATLFANVRIRVNGFSFIAHLPTFYNVIAALD
jgi:hypothetical protein